MSWEGKKRYTRDSVGQERMTTQTVSGGPGRAAIHCVRGRFVIPVNPSAQMTENYVKKIEVQEKAFAAVRGPRQLRR